MSSRMGSISGRRESACSQRSVWEGPDYLRSTPTLPPKRLCGLARSSSVASVEAANHGSVRLLGWRSMPRVRCDVLRGPDAYPVAL